MDRFIRFRGGWRAFAVGMNRLKVGFVPLEKHLFLAVFVATGASSVPTAHSLEIRIFERPSTNEHARTHVVEVIMRYGACQTRPASFKRSTSTET